MALFEGWEAARPAPAPQRAQPFGNYPAPRIEPVDTTGTEDERVAFTVAMLRDPRDPMGTAVRLFGASRSAFCAAIAGQWPNAAWFATLKQELIEEFGEAHFLPSREQIAREIYNQASSLGVYDPENSLKAYKLYCEVMDYVKTSGGANVTIDNRTQNVMLVRDQGSDEDWEAKTKAQQAKLVSAA